MVEPSVTKREEKFIDSKKEAYIKIQLRIMKPY